MDTIGLGITVLSVGIWIGLLGFRGQFWRADQRLVIEKFPTRSVGQGESLPKVCAVIPARNEAELLPTTLRSLLAQDYPGCLTVIVVDDQSTDQTATIAQALAQESKQSSQRFQLEVLSGQELPPGWTGKLWALEQGIRYGQQQTPAPDYFLFTDADIEHDPANLRQLLTKAEIEHLDLVSLMVLLRCQDFWERLLIPAFVFFFQKLYPFAWVNNPTKSTAAAAGGCILIRHQALNRIGGIEVVRQALIDDCALAQAVKSSNQSRSSSGSLSGLGGIWLGLSQSTRSLRPYPSLASIWNMIARTAFTQLEYSPWLLVGTVMAMTLIYLVAPIGLILSVLTGHWLNAIASFVTWLLMALAYLPTLRLYQCSPLLGFCLPGIGLLYTLMTIDSAWRHWQGRGGAWKGRVYSVEG
ncbi:MULTISPECIES: glycosyltransferase [Moorena]|uniref:Hopene-associated glycosyltransferase HpnB n=1 Tax=Moorena producens 3L TaxID=489825 RepID=F4Y2C7_9CYAN|nr:MULTISPECIES: glycosyltransferase [Moorena]NEQ14609.1 glycosyltransferase [Moorena sp. SIO3E2]EGJ28771.1 hopene-associated glycosyltransferase HpnB [Moorena producens 3L]NEP66114.1 glycosyltransferase [Moorena sp. SIO3A5]NER90939.1 glycosyltransferase [Moorena sp. SIO3A2]NES40817.1 glycosyltransferase [Moorena sp. SIO2C4]